MIPRYLIAKVGGLPAGLRLEKRPTVVWSARTVTPARNYAPVLNASGDEDDLAFRQLNFTNEEYRFWCAEITNDQTGDFVTAICRGCETTHYTQATRKAHLNAGCSKRILKAYQLLLKDKKCIVCDKWTSNQKWGVPICTQEGCMHSFKHQTPQSTAMQAAIFLVDQGMTGVDI